MLIVFGRIFVGKVDEVPHLFHLETQFAHIYYFPLLPSKTYLVVKRTGQHIPIGFSGKSILLAWSRAALIVITAISAIAMSANLAWGSAWTISAGVFAAAACLLSFI